MYLPLRVLLLSFVVVAVGDFCFCCCIRSVGNGGSRSCSVFFTCRIRIVVSFSKLVKN